MTCSNTMFRTIDKAFSVIRQTLIKYTFMQVMHSKGQLSISFEGSDQKIILHGYDIPCFDDVIPEMMTAYLLQELLTITQAAYSLRHEAIVTSNYNIQAKLMWLRKLGQHNDTFLSAKESRSTKSHRARVAVA